MTPGQARTAIARLRDDRPELFEAAPPAGYWRGIDIYKAKALPIVFARACQNFINAHGRPPDLITMPTTADHFFAMKFFHPIPIDPNPADKLEARKFLSRVMLRRIGLPRRVWVSGTPELPAADAIPRGTYWLKISNGNAMQHRIVWPPTEEERRDLNARARQWKERRYGLDWGEWWYGLTKPRFFLECDLSSRMADRPEINVFVCRGNVKTFYAIRRGAGRPYEQSYFDCDLNPLPGRFGGHRPFSGRLPETIGLILEAAREIGRRFNVVRVDFLNAAGEHPLLGEISLCANNARRMLSPPKFDRWARDQIFGPPG